MSAVDLGSLQIAIEANTQGLTKSMPAIDRLEKAILNLSGTVDKMSKSVNSSYTKATTSVVSGSDKIIKSTAKVQSQFKNTESAVFKARESLKSMAASYSHLSNKGKIVSELTRATEWHNRMLQKDNLTTKQAAKIQRAYQASVNKVKNSIKQTDAPMTGWKTRMQSMSKSASLALGPMNSVAARINSMTGL